jgi:hypothetical protein
MHLQNNALSTLRRYFELRSFAMSGSPRPFAARDDVQTRLFITFRMIINAGLSFFKNGNPSLHLPHTLIEADADQIRQQLAMATLKLIR